jgi:hypothetical protein
MLLVVLATVSACSRRSSLYIEPGAREPAGSAVNAPPANSPSGNSMAP